MALILSRRTALKSGAAAFGLALAPAFRSARAAGETETYGLSSFGDLALAAGFQALHLRQSYAPKAGLLSVQITNTGGNQNFDTFNTLNVYSTKGDGAWACRVVSIR